MSNLSQKAKRKATRQKVVAIIAVIVLIITAAVLYFKNRVAEEYASSDTDSVLSAQVTTGSIQTTVSGSGSLTGEGIEDVDVPDAVSLDTVYVEVGDTVQAGDALASVKSSEVLSALSSVQSALDTLDDEISDAKDDTVSSTVSAGISGRVKAIYAEAGDDVATVMYEHGALAVLSLDGKMQLTLSVGGYTAGDTVTVTTSDGTEYEGTVSTSTDAETVVLLTDNGPALGDTASVDGVSGTLEVHQMLKVTGYAGTISRVSTSLNTQVYSSTTLFTLTDTSDSASYDKLLAQRAEYEEMYNTLVKLYKDGAVLAPCDGTVLTVPSTSSTSTTTALTSSATTDVLAETTQFTVDPGLSMSVTISVDETNILSLEEGQTASITVESVGEDTYTGEVTEIDTTASSSDGVTAYTATVTLDRADGMLSGMTAEVSITIQGVENALLVPSDAVHKTSATAYVYTSYDTETQTYGDPVEVTVGLSDGDYTEITEGLTEGQTVYYTESEDSNMFSFSFDMGGMSDMGGGSSDFGGGGNDFGGGGGGGGDMPGGFGN